MSARAEKLTEILKDLENNSAINGSAIVSLKGQLMASALHSDTNAAGVSAMSAALTSVATRVGATLNSGDINQVVLTGKDKIIMVNSMSKAVLITLAPADAKVGLLDFEIGQAIEKIELTLG